MKILVLGDCIIYHPILSYLEEKGYQIDIIQSPHFIDSSQYDCIFFPVEGVKKNYVVGSMVLSPDFLVQTKENVLLFSGKETPCLRELLERSKRVCTYFLQDQEIKKVQKIYENESILGNILEKAPLPIYGSKIVIISDNLPSNHLLFILKGMGADVSIILDQKEKQKSFVIPMFQLDTKEGKREIERAQMIVDFLGEEKIKTYLPKDAYYVQIGFQNSEESNILENPTKVLSLGKRFLPKVEEKIMKKA